MLLTIIRKELLLAARDVHALLVLFLMPTVFIIIMSLSLQETYQKSDEEKYQIGLLFVNKKDSDSSFGQSLKKIEGFNFKLFEDESSLINETQIDDLQAAIIVPEGFIKKIQREYILDESNRLKIYYAPSTPYALCVLIESAIQVSILANKLEKIHDEIGLPQESRNKNFNSSGLFTIQQLYSNQAAERPTSVQQSVPAWLIFSMFFVVIPITTTFLSEKQNGTLQRLKTLPIPTSYFLIGKLVPYLGINLVQTFLMFMVGIYVVPLLGGQALVMGDQSWLLLPMSVAVSISAITLALLIATLVKTTEQATTIGGLINLIIAALGGIMVPTFVMPQMMQDIALFSPMNWGLEGFLTILLRGGDFTAIVPEIGKFFVFSLIMFSLATFCYHRATRVY